MTKLVAIVRSRLHTGLHRHRAVTPARRHRADRGRWGIGPHIDRAWRDQSGRVR